MMDLSTRVGPLLGPLKGHTDTIRTLRRVGCEIFDACLDGKLRTSQVGILFIWATKYELFWAVSSAYPNVLRTFRETCVFPRELGSIELANHRQLDGCLQALSTCWEPLPCTPVNLSTAKG